MNYNAKIEITFVYFQTYCESNKYLVGNILKVNWKQNKLKQMQSKKQANKNQWESYQAIVDKGKTSSGRKREVLNSEEISFFSRFSKS